jgi:hypothetical protein
VAVKFRVVLLIICVRVVCHMRQEQRNFPWETWRAIPQHDAYEETTQEVEDWMPILQGQARKGMSTTHHELVCCANARSATRFAHNVPHAVLGIYSATTSYKQDQLPAPYLLERPHITLGEMKQDCWAVALIDWKWSRWTSFRSVLHLRTRPHIQNCMICDCCTTTARSRSKLWGSTCRSIPVR